MITTISVAITPQAIKDDLVYTWYMTNNKLPKPKKKDKDWQEKIAKNLEREKIQLDHSRGLERFKRVIKQIGKKPQ